MKIEIINNDPSGANGYEVWDVTDNKRINSRSALFPSQWSDDDIFNLLGEKKFKQFEDGKYQFDVANKMLFIATNDYSFYLPRFAYDKEVLSRTNL